MVNRSARRRRQRRVRIGVAAMLLAIATAGALPALIAQSPLWLSVALLTALLCGYAATRIVYTEVLQARREAAAAAARQAVDYQLLSAQRSEQNIQFSTAMAERLHDRDRSIKELDGTIRLAEKRAEVAEKRARFESQRADAARDLLSELQDERATEEARHAGEADDAQIPIWDDPDLETVVDLMNWEDRVISRNTDDGDHRKHA